jgi:hypothetical protein
MELCRVALHGVLGLFYLGKSSTCKIMDTTDEVHSIDA